MAVPSSSTIRCGAISTRRAAVSVVRGFLGESAAVVPRGIAVRFVFAN
jgi:hypothetical protein